MLNFNTNNNFLTIPICWLISYVGYIAQERIDFAKEIKRLKSKTIWTMSESELDQYLRSKGIKAERREFVQLVLKGWSYGQISAKLGYSESTMWDWSEDCRKKLNIKSWDVAKN